MKKYISGPLSLKKEREKENPSMCCEGEEGLESSKEQKQGDSWPLATLVVLEAGPLCVPALPLPSAQSADCPRSCYSTSAWEGRQGDSGHLLKVYPTRLPVGLVRGVRERGIGSESWVWLEQLCGSGIIYWNGKIRRWAGIGVRRIKSSVLNMLQLRFLLANLLGGVCQVGSRDRSLELEGRTCRWKYEFQRLQHLDYAWRLGSRWDYFKEGT